MSSPRVLFVDHAGVLGGAELYLLDVARHFRESSRVLLFESGPFVDRLHANDVPVSLCEAPPGVLDVKKSAGWQSALQSIPGLLRLTSRLAWQARDYDLLYANSQKSLFVAGLAGVLARRPVIWNLHDMLTSDHFSRFNRRLATLWANLFADHVIVNSMATKDAFANSGGRPEKTTVIYNGIDAAPFDDIEESDAQALRDDLPVPSDAPLVGVFSRLAPWKGQHVVLEALSHLPNVHCVFVGDTLFRGDEPYEDTLRDTAERLGVIDRSHFVGFRDDIPRLMHAVDIVVHASTQPEPFGRVIVEGMLAQRPVIATAAGGAQEIVEHRETGLLTSPGDAQELSSAIDWILSQPQEAQRLAQAGRERARERFSIDTMVSQIATVLQQYAPL